MVSGEDNQSFTMVISVSGFEPSLNSVLKKSVCMSIYLSIYSSVGTLSVYLSIYLEMLSIEACLRFSIIVSNFVRLYKMWFSTVGGTPSNCRVGNQLYLWNQWKIYNVSICLSWAYCSSYMIIFGCFHEECNYSGDNCIICKYLLVISTEWLGSVPPNYMWIT